MKRYLQLGVWVCLVGCGAGESSSSTRITRGIETNSPEPTVGAAGRASADPAAPPSFSCRYTNPFSREKECKGYSGEGWSLTVAKTDCGAIFGGTPAALDRTPCADAGAFGTCTTSVGQAREAITWYYGRGDAALTGSVCENFEHGRWSSTTSGMTPPVSGTAMPEALAALNSGPDVDVTPACADAACVEMLIEAHRGFEFRPASRPVRTGFVFFPGAGVDVTAYAPEARAIAAQGYLVILVPVPGRAALGSQDRAAEVIAAHPEIMRWVIGGHSMGGAAAGLFFAAHEDLVQGLMLWAAYPEAGDEIASGLVYLIYGTRDGLATPTMVAEHRRLLPSDTQYVELNGADHNQFGWYESEPTDQVASISRATQQVLVAGATVHCLRRVETGPTVKIDPVFERAEAIGSSICRTAQRRVAGASEALLPDSAVDVRASTDVGSFARLEPEIKAGRTPHVVVPAYTVQVANPRWIEEPPVIVGEVWCKLVSAEALAGVEGWAQPLPRSCAEANRAVLDQAAALLDQRQRERSAASARRVLFAVDAPTANADVWYDKANVELVSDGKTLIVRSPSLVVPTRAVNAHGQWRTRYCKLWSPSRALEWLLFGNGSAPGVPGGSKGSAWR